MLVTVTHHDDYSGIEGEEYEEEVPDNASLQEIWDIVVNGRSKSDEITSHWAMEQAEEGLIYFDDNNEAYAGHRIEICWEPREPGTYKIDQKEQGDNDSQIC